MGGKVIYQWLDNVLSGYLHIKHLHNNGIFGFGLESSSHIERFWNSMKLLIKSIYKSIPQKNFLLFLKEVEWKFKIRGKNYDDKILEFLDAIKLVKEVGDDYIEDTDFLTNEDLNIYFNEDDSDSEN